MKKSAEKILKIAGAAAVGTAAAGAVSYMTAKCFIDAALDRETPRIMRNAGRLISGTVPDKECDGKMRKAAEKLLNADVETVEITAFDGVLLVGHWYPCENPKRIIVAMHGWRSSWNKDFGLIADFWHDNGCSVLFAEQRGQNNSGGKYMGFGVTERYDCRDWVNWVINNRSDTLPVYLAGVSMGATTVMMTAGLELPQNVHGIITDCGFTSPDEIWKHVANNNIHISYMPCRRFAHNFYRRKTCFSPCDCTTVDALHVSSVPVLFIHGTDDSFVPIEMTYENYKACASPKRLLVVPGAGHAMSYLVDKESYENTMKDFWRDFDR